MCFGFSKSKRDFDCKGDKYLSVFIVINLVWFKNVSIVIKYKWIVYFIKFCMSMIFV